MISTIGVAFNIAIYKLWMISTIGVAFNIAIYNQKIKLKKYLKN